MKINVIITGTTGMVGEGVLIEALSHPEVEKVLVVNRKPCGVSHPKLKEVIHNDFFDIAPIADQLKGYNSCFFCLGVTSVGIDKFEYYRLTYTLTMHFAGVLSEINPDMIFCYISGAGTDSTEKGRLNWARVKGKTENDLMKLSFKKVFAFRPGFLEPTEGMKNVHSYYKKMAFLMPVMKFLIPNKYSTLKDIGLAMIVSVTRGYEKQILEVSDIKKLAGG